MFKRLFAKYKIVKTRSGMYIPYVRTRVGWEGIDSDWPKRYTWYSKKYVLTHCLHTAQEEAKKTLDEYKLFFEQPEEKVVYIE